MRKGWPRERGATPGHWLVLLAFASACGAAERNEDPSDTDTNSSSAGGTASSATGGGTASSATGGDTASSATGGDTASSATDGNTTGGSELDSVFEHLATDACQDDCSNEGSYLELVYGQTCLEIYAGVYESMQANIQRFIDRGTVSFDAARAPGCYDELAQTHCEELLPACTAMFVGQVPAGSACSDSLECVSGGYCNRQLGCPGVCEDRLPPGAPCDYGTCAVGESCSPEGVCELPQPNGEPCAAFANCLSNYCDNDSVCAEAPVNFATAEGQPCEWPYECQPNLYCDLDLAEPVCVPAPELGEACNAGSVAIVCASGAYCGVDGVCLERIPVGGRCEKPDECATFVCDAGVCQEHSLFGEPCVTNDRCYGVCEGGVCAPGPECGSAG